MNRKLYIPALATLLFAPQKAWATLNVSSLYMGGITWGQIMNNIIGTAGRTIFSVAGAAFLLGALMYIGGFVSEENKSKGKGMMIGGLMGMALVLSALAIFNTVLYFLYGP